MTFSQALTRKQALLFREHQRFASWASQWRGWHHISNSGAHEEEKRKVWTGWIANVKQTDPDWIECEMIIRQSSCQERNPDGFQRAGEDNVQVYKKGDW